MSVLFPKYDDQHRCVEAVSTFGLCEAIARHLDIESAEFRCPLRSIFNSQLGCETDHFGGISIQVVDYAAWA